ncbi:DUF2138 domain-containing protein [Aeromonas cavernicola]|uniref:DUF2138 domain-containing protein n=1 Tax=Aeromonas cavernicola TaxID=1006623 RepID=A0A2H9U0D1_9GAMM|nr:DUF2138 domain-containing protein [Aeromonas cavernicola]PJG57502.1 DUF2138 domain-containing protein [Aeromonas cavernicola]
MSEPANISPAERPAAPGSRRRLLLIGLIVALFGAGGAAFALLPLSKPAAIAPLSAPQAPYDITTPDALIESVSLSQLPKAVLEVPLLRELLTEDLVFYYEHNADRLGLLGALRRIIYEHDLTLKESLLTELLDQPVQMALWRGQDGRLSDTIMVLRRGGLAKLLEPLAKVAASDSQLTQVAEIAVGGDITPVYQLRYGAGKRLLLLSHDDQLVIFSSPDMLLSLADGETPAVLEPAMVALAVGLLQGEQPFAQHFALPPRGELRQRITLGASVLAMGYERLMPTFSGVRFEQGNEGWQSYLALSEVPGQSALDFTPIWQAMPMGASACVALPLIPALYENLLVQLGAEQQRVEALTDYISGVAGLCWYGDSRLYSPLVVLKLTEVPPPEFDQMLGTLFGHLVGAVEPARAEGVFPVVTKKSTEGTSWQRVVSSRFGQYPAAKAPAPEQISGPAFFKVSLLRDNEMLLFSLDDQLLDKARNTLRHRFPPLAEVLPKDRQVPAYLAPNTLSTLLKQEMLSSLPRDMEPVFRNAAETLLPRLSHLATQQSYGVVLPNTIAPVGTWSWLALEWRPL